MAAGAAPTPETLRVDSQTMRTGHGGPRGYDGGEKVVGRKRFAVADSLGLVWGLVVTAANVQDRDIGSWLLGGLRWRLGWVREMIADAGFSTRFVDWVGRWYGWAVVTTHNAPEGFRIHPRRWVVERTFAWLVKYRRLVRDYEVWAEVSEAMIYAAMTHRMIRRLRPAA